MICSKCGKNRLSHKHHVTYIPERIEVLCPFCHSLITSINTRYAKWKSCVKLTNEEREMIYLFFKKSDKRILEAILKKKDNAKEIKKRVRYKRTPLYIEE